MEAYPVQALVHMKKHAMNFVVEVRLQYYRYNNYMYHNEAIYICVHVHVRIIYYTYVYVFNLYHTHST